ncbi:MAG: TaqI-like C-terminal specificity domain-containing protein, partial [Melioribacter sp.]|nr:TaqI-like C-terminal specificity domain-containing protein [Melioribacter sp.]
ESKAKKRDDQGDYWWELRACAYYPEFEKEKVVWKALGLEPAFAFVPPGIYNNDKANLLTSNTISLKFLVGFFNSNIFQWVFKSIGINMGQGFEYKLQFIELIPLPPHHLNQRAHSKANRVAGG